MKIGTTKRGIGPAYEDKVGRRAIRLMDFAEPDTLDEKIARLLAHHDAAAPGPGARTGDRRRRIRAELDGVAPKILPYMDATWELLDAARARRQAHSVRRCARRATRRRPRHLSFRDLVQYGRRQRRDRFGPWPQGDRLVLGIAKAYTTSVGGGPFPTELQDRSAKRIGERGREFGTYGPAPALRLVRRGAGAADRENLRHRRHRPDQTRHSRRLRARSRSASAIELDGERSTGSRQARRRRPASSRSTRRSKGGKARPPARGPGRNCRPRRSNMSAGSRS